MYFSIPKISLSYTSAKEQKGEQENGDINELPVGTIFGIGKNYGGHIREMNWQDLESVIFIKPRTSLFNGNGKISLPAFSKEIHYEVEIILHIGKAGNNISKEKAPEYIYGIGVGLDLTARDWQKKAKEKGHPWAISKGFDNSAIASKMLRYESVKNIYDLEIMLLCGNQIRQKGSVREMILKPDEIVSYISRFFSLSPGDLIFTGTPKGVDSIKAGDQIEIRLMEKNKDILSSIFLF